MVEQHDAMEAVIRGAIQEVTTLAEEIALNQDIASREQSIVLVAEIQQLAQSYDERIQRSGDHDTREALFAIQQELASGVLSVETEKLGSLADVQEIIIQQLQQVSEQYRQEASFMEYGEDAGGMQGDWKVQGIPAAKRELPDLH